MGIFRSNNSLDYAQVDGIVIDERAPEADIQGVSTNKVLLVGQFQRGLRRSNQLALQKLFMRLMVKIFLN